MQRKEVGKKMNMAEVAAAAAAAAPAATQRQRTRTLLPGPLSAKRVTSFPPAHDVIPSQLPHSVTSSPRDPLSP